MKKLLALMLSVAMIFTVGTSVMAYSDVEEGAYVSEAVTVLSGLDTLQGFEDGMFRPEEEVTRAQMAAIVCRMLGYEEQAQASKGTTAFTDVAGNHWASGYVNVAYAQDIINGYGNGMFGPEDSVTYEQAIKMIVSALGYDLAAERKGGYPTGYIAIASAEGITKKANGTVGKAANRGTIAVLVYNALEVNLMDQLAWSSDGKDTYTKTNETILSKYLGITKYEGVVTDTPITNGDLIDIVEMTLDDSHSFSCDKVDVNSYFGKNVVIYVGEDEITGKETVFAIAENDVKNETLKISATQLIKKDADGINYKKINSNKILDIKVDDEVVSYVNYNVVDDVNTTEALLDVMPNGGTIEFISNDGDSEYEIINVIAYDDEAVIEDVDKINGTYRFDLYIGSRPNRIDVNDEDEIVIVYKDNEIADVKDIKANDTVSYVNINGIDMYFVSSATVTGTVESYDDENNIVTINGEDYEVSTLSNIDVTRLNGEEGTFFLNIDGQIAYNKTAPTVSGNYALVLATYTSASGVNSDNYLQVVLADGTIAEYRIGTKAKVIDVDGDTVSNDVKAYFDDKFTGSKENSDAEFATVSEVQVVKLAVSGNKVSKITLLDSSNEASATNKFDKEAMSIGRIDIANDTVIFSISADEDELVDIDNIVIGTANDFFIDGEEIGGTVIAYDEDRDIYNAAIGIGLTKAVDPTSDLFIVTSVKTTIIDDTEAYIVTGIQNGEEIKVTLYNEDEAIVAPSKGDIILLAEANAEGYVTEIEVLFDGTRHESEAKANDEIFSGYGKVVVSSRNKFAIDSAIVNDATDDEEIAAEEEISYRAAATYTLLDYTENSRNPEVSIEAGSEWLFDVTEYESYAFVRYVDGRMAEVVIYRMAEINKD